MDKYDSAGMQPDMWYEPAATTDNGSYTMHNTMDQVLPPQSAMPARSGVSLKTFLPALPYVAFLIIALLLWRVGAGPGLFPIRHVKVEGPFQQVSRASIKDMVTPEVQSGFFHFSGYRLKSQLLANPWIADVVVKRQWPDGVALVLREHQPQFRWQNSGLVSEQQHLFFPQHYSADTWYHLPHLSGPEAFWRNAATVASQLQAEIATGAYAMRLRSVHVSDRQSWTVKVNEGLSVKLGREQPVAKFKQFLNAYAEMPVRERNRVNTIDMRYSDGMAVQ